MKPFRHHFRVPFHELDPAGVLFHAHVFGHAHQAYEELLQELGWSLAALLKEGRLALPLVEAHADYQRPLHLDDQVEIQVGVVGIGNTSFTLQYRFLRGEAPCVRVRTSHVTVDRRSGEAIPLPVGLATALARYRLEKDGG
jgi:YbgC/YbaW family acyl-CoA thioester hydrolase